MVTGSVYIDLSHEPDTCSSADRQSLASIEHVPDGARVVVEIGARQFLSSDAVRFLHPHAERLEIDVRGTSGAQVRTWVEAIRAGRDWLEVVA